MLMVMNYKGNSRIFNGIISRYVTSLTIFISTRTHVHRHTNTENNIVARVMNVEHCKYLYEIQHPLYVH